MIDQIVKNEFFNYLGLLAASLIALKVVVGVSKYIFKSLICSPVNLSKFKGKWALVTGATDGIGKSFSRALARKGLNIVLVSRTQSKLDAVAEEISREFKVRTLTIAVDFVNDDENNYKLKVAHEIEGLEIAILVNNVGMSYDMPAPFLEMEGGTDETVSGLVKCNILSTNNMTSLILPQMVERQSGVVINMSSFSGFTTTPLLSVYSATKAYVDFFTRGLGYEYKDKGITFQCLGAGYVVSNISKIKKPSLLVATPDAYVNSALKRLGVESRTTGYWSHDLLLKVMTCLPQFLATKLTFDALMGVRKRALKKKFQ